MPPSSFHCSRRRLLGGAAALAAAGLLPLSRASAEETPRRLLLKPARQPLVGPGYPETEIWGYDGLVPGPTLKVRQGERLTVEVENRLPIPTTVHWHGIRLPNAMDGVPNVTQAPIAPGETFLYDFTVPDAGTFWYHPHLRSAEAQDRGLAGALIVEEAAPPAVDRELVWLLDDWRLTEEAQISEDFGNPMDMSHGGRLGNSVTVNGRIPEALALRAGELIRLRLINAANARIFGLEFEGHAPLVIALDGQPVEPHAPEGGRIVLGPAMRADLLLACNGAPGASYRVVDRFYERFAYRLLDLRYGTEAPLLRTAVMPQALPANPLAMPDLASAERHRLVFAGGMMGGMTGARLNGRELGARELFAAGKAWAINGIAAGAHEMEPLLKLALGRSYRLELVNDTAWHHPIHLHGHSFLLLSQNGAAPPRQVWLDTLLMAPREAAEIAFVADNPGLWMLHCHVPEHQEGGMMGLVSVA